MMVSMPATSAASFERGLKGDDFGDPRVTRKGRRLMGLRLGASVLYSAITCVVAVVARAVEFS